MKKAMVYILALTVLFSTMLAGCGETRGTDNRSVLPTNSPETSIVPETMMPNPEDGVVRDNDGIITDGDTGTGASSGAGSSTNSMNGGTGNTMNGNTGSGAATNGTAGSAVR